MHLVVKGKQLDVGEALRRHVEDSLTTVFGKYFGEPIHPNTDGHILMTERILEFIGQHRLLPFWTVPPPPAQQKG